MKLGMHSLPLVFHINPFPRILPLTSALLKQMNSPILWFVMHLGGNWLIRYPLLKTWWHVLCLLILGPPRENGLMITVGGMDQQ